MVELWGWLVMVQSQPEQLCCRFSTLFSGDGEPLKDFKEKCDVIGFCVERQGLCEMKRQAGE